MRSELGAYFVFKHPLIHTLIKIHSCFCRNHFYDFRKAWQMMWDIKIVSLNPILLLLEYYLILNIPVTSKRTKAGLSMSTSHCWTLFLQLLSVHMSASHHFILPILPSDFLSSIYLKRLFFFFLLFLSLSTFFPCEPQIPVTNMVSRHLKILAHLCYFLLKYG